MGEQAPSNRCRLLELPDELIVPIGEHVFRQEPAIISIGPHLFDASCTDSYGSTSITCGYILTCKRIHKACANLRYEVNTVRLYAPAFSTEPFEVFRRMSRDDTITLLTNFAEFQTKRRQLRRLKVFLGNLPTNLVKMRWMEFMGGWISVKNALKTLRVAVPGLRLEFGLFLKDDVACRVEFSAGKAEDITMEKIKCRLKNGNPAEMTDVELEKLGKIVKTVAKTLSEETETGVLLGELK